MNTNEIPDGYESEEYEEHSTPGNKTDPRSTASFRFTPKQWDVLDREYKVNPQTYAARSLAIAEEIGCTDRQVIVGFVTQYVSINTEDPCGNIY